MRVFVTGATGFVGSAVVAELLAAGHQVLGLARSDAKAAGLAASGAEIHIGSMEDLEGLRRGATGADAVIHTAFNHDFSKFVENCETDRRAIEALGSALEGSDRPLIVTSGVALLAPGRISVEDDVTSADFPRKSEEAAAALAERGIRTSVVRLPPSVHGVGDHGFVPVLIGLAREKGVSRFAGDGLNRWPAVHRLDAAKLYRLVLEHGARERSYHAIAEEGVPFRDIAGVIGRRLDVPVLASNDTETEAHFGWFARFASIDCPASAERTKAVLSWQPTEIGLIEDVGQPYYFESESVL